MHSLPLGIVVDRAIVVYKQQNCYNFILLFLLSPPGIAPGSILGCLELSSFLPFFSGHVPCRKLPGFGAGRGDVRGAGLFWARKGSKHSRACFFSQRPTAHVSVGSASLHCPLLLRYSPFPPPPPPHLLLAFKLPLLSPLPPPLFIV